MKHIGEKNKISAFFFLMSMLVFSTFVQSEKILNDNIDIPHFVIPFTPLIIAVILGLITLVFLFFKKKIKIDVLVLLLTIRLLFPLFALLYEPISSEFMGNYATLVMGIIAYIIALNCPLEDKTLKKIVLLVFFIICFQTWGESILGATSFFDDTYRYKNDLIIPIGGSNSITTKLIPMFILLYSIENNKRKQFLYVFIIFFTTILTKSRSGILIAIFVTAIYEAWNRKISIRSILSFISGVLLIGVIIIYFIIQTDWGNLAFSLSTNTVLGRLTLLEGAFDLFLLNPIFGSGFSDSLVFNNPHNYILYTLVAFGILGFFLFFIIFIKIFYSLYQFSHVPLVKGMACFLISILTQGLGEIVLYSYVIEFMLWFMVGNVMANINLIKLQSKSQARSIGD